MPEPVSGPVRLITFDLGNVLVKVDHMEFCRRLAALAHRSPVEIFDCVFNSPLEPQYDTGRLTSQEFHRRIVTHFQVSLDFETFARWWNSLFSPMPDMEETVRRLAGNYPLFLLSNTNALHFPYIREHYPLLRYFSEFVLSFQVGSRKPEPGIYDHLIHRAALPPEQVLFIDDKLPFVAAARQRGLQAWHFSTSTALQEQLSASGLW